MSLTAERRQVLELLAASPGGCTKGRLLADGFTVDMLADLVREGLATAQRGTLRVGGRTIRVERYRITDAGRCPVQASPSPTPTTSPAPVRAHLSTRRRRGPGRFVFGGTTSVQSSVATNIAASAVANLQH
jgi:hypothetical protein